MIVGTYLSVAMAAMPAIHTSIGTKPHVPFRPVLARTRRGAQAHSFGFALRQLVFYGDLLIELRARPETGLRQTVIEILNRWVSRR